MWREESAKAIFAVLFFCECLLKDAPVACSQKVDAQVSGHNRQCRMHSWVLIRARNVGPNVGGYVDVGWLLRTHATSRPNEISWISHSTRFPNVAL